MCKDIGNSDSGLLLLLHCGTDMRWGIHVHFCSTIDDATIDDVYFGGLILLCSC